MRIVNIMLAKGLGGIEQSFLDYTHVLQARGHDVHSVVHPKARVAASLDTLTSHLHTLPNMGEWDWFAIFQLYRLLKRLQPDVVIAHGNRALRLAQRARAKPLVTVMHNYKIRCQYAHSVLAPTQDLLHFAEQKGVPRAQLHHVPNMVHTPHEMPQHAWQKKPVIGAMGRLVAKKGFEVFLAALAILREREVEFHAVIAGDGEEMEALKSQAQREGTMLDVEFMGWVRDKREFFDIVDIFCLPSHHEPFGIVLLEAMAQALPVVSTASEGPSEIIEQGMDGVLVPVGEATAMADALEVLLHNPARAARLGSNAYETVQTKYAQAIVGAKLELALQAACTL